MKTKKTLAVKEVRITLDRYVWNIVNRLVEEIWKNQSYQLGRARVYVAVNRNTPGAADQFVILTEMDTTPDGYDYIQQTGLYPVSRAVTKEQLGSAIRKALHSEPAIPEGMEFNW